MKFLKGISLFVLYPLVMFGIGFFAGVKCTHFFYPGEQIKPIVLEKSESMSQTDAIQGQENVHAGNTSESINTENKSVKYMGEAEIEQVGMELTNPEAVSEVSSSMETLSVDTEYILEETDILSGTVVEISGKLPDKYIGLNREQFLDALKAYELFPPLSEMERGFVNLELLSFSGERVVVQMNYQYLQPSPSFYLAVRDNEVVVYLEDRRTIYINTGIALDSLPEKIQQEIIQMIWVEDEERLYYFLESYSS